MDAIDRRDVHASWLSTRIIRIVLCSGTMLIPFCYTSKLADNASFKWYVFEGLMLLVAGIWLAETRILARPRSKTAFLALAYLCWLCLAWMTSRFAWAGLDRIREVVAVMVLFFSVRQWFDRASVNRLLRFVVLAGCHIAAISLVQRMGVNRFAGHYSATIGHQNFLASFLIPPVFISLAMAQDKRGSSLMRLLYAGCGIFMGVILVWTKSRGGMVGMILGASGAVFLSVWAHARFRGFFRKHAWKLFAAALVLIVFGWIALPGAARARINDIKNIRQDTVRFRFIVWKDTLRMIAEHPWLGWGPGTYRLVIESYRDPVLSYDPGISKLHNATNTFILHAHNEYLEIAAEAGMPGAVLFVFFAIAAVGIPIVDVLRKRGTSFMQIACFGAALGVLAHAFFSPASRIPDVNWNLWATAACIAVLQQREGEAT